MQMLHYLKAKKVTGMIYKTKLVEND